MATRPFVAFANVRNVSEFQRGELRRIWVRPDFAQFVLMGDGTDIPVGLSPEGRIGPRVWCWYDTAGALHAERIGVARTLHTATAEVAHGR